MKGTRLINYSVFATLCWLLGGCGLGEWIEPKKVFVTGRIVEKRTNAPIEGTSIRTYRQIFNCGFGCSTYERVDSAFTAKNGNFSFQASDENLELYVFKKGYFGLYPGEGRITQRTQIGTTDYKTIVLQPYAEIEVKYINVVSDRDSLVNQYYACGDPVNIGAGSPTQLGKEYVFKWPVEGNCLVDIYTTVYRRGTRTSLKNSFYVPQGSIAQKTIEY